MRKTIQILTALIFIASGWWVGEAKAGITIKVRALNPLETMETAVINYPLPQEISQEDILGQKMTYSMEWPASEVEADRDQPSPEDEPRKTHFQISFNDKTGGYYIDDEVVLLPKEVVTLEVYVKDVWVVGAAQIEGLRREAAEILQEWEVGARHAVPVRDGEEPDVGAHTLRAPLRGNFELETEDEESEREETQEIVLILQEEILDGLSRIIERQDENEIIKVGVERHILAHEDSMADLRQVQQDLLMLENVIRLEEEEREEE